MKAVGIVGYKKSGKTTLVIGLSKVSKELVLVFPFAYSLSNSKRDGIDKITNIIVKPSNFFFLFQNQLKRLLNPFSFSCSFND